MQNIIEALRQDAVDKLFTTNGFNNCWPTWKTKINSLASANTSNQILNLGDNLKEIFFTTNTSTNRSQGDVAGGGANWEGLVCWYLNLCLIGRRTVVIKHSKKLIPSPVSDAITVNYMNFTSNTESDLIAITFPDLPEYSINKNNIVINDTNGSPVPTSVKGKYNTKAILDALSNRDFDKLEIHVIQCKTNWNDNAQIPMLWDMIYSANAFKTNITIGKNGYSINNIKKFTYSFVTVPTVKLDKIKPTSTQVKRVTNLSGGNYWGLKSASNIASSVKEMLDRNLKSGHQNSHLNTIASEIIKINTDYSYFRL